MAKYSDVELEELGIERITAPGRGNWESNAYVYKCARCGRPTVKQAVILGRPIYCSFCHNNTDEKRKLAAKAIERDAKELELLMGIDPKHEDRFEKAVKAVRAIGNFEQAIKQARSMAHKFGSVPEAMAAIILISCKIEIVPQSKIFDNKRAAVDFVLPEHKVVIEIDGSLYHADKQKLILRDATIRQRLGRDWTVMHIPAEDLVKSPRVFRKYILKRFAK